MIAVLAWWVLVVTRPANQQSPRLLSYPSAEFCRLAMHELIPQDSQFWTEPERAARQTLQAHLDQEGLTIPRDGRYHVAKDGHAFARMPSGALIAFGAGAPIPDGPILHALTGCVEVGS